MFGSALLVHAALRVPDVHRSCHVLSDSLLISFILFFTSAAGIPLSHKAYIWTLSVATRSTGTIPAKTNTASSDTVLYVLVRRGATNLCTLIRYILLHADFIAFSAYTGATHRKGLITTFVRTERFKTDRPPTFGISIATAIAAADALSATPLT